MPTRNPRIPCPQGCGILFSSNHIPRHARRCLGASPTIADLCRVGDVRVCATGCWMWGATFQEGDPERYGLVTNAVRDRFGERYAHRLALILDGRPPGDLNALHHCDRPPCVRPDHLYVGTDRDNMRDMTERGRRRGTFASWTDEQWAREFARRAVPPDDIRACEVCGTAFTARPHMTTRACSRECGRTLSWRARKRGELA